MLSPQRTSSDKEVGNIFKRNQTLQKVKRHDNAMMS